MEKRNSPLFFGIFVAVLTIILVANEAKIIAAEIFFTKGSRLLQNNKGNYAQQLFQKAIKLNPDEPTYLSTTALEWAKAANSPAAIEKSQRLANAAYKLNPNNHLTLKKLFNTYYLLAQQDKHFLQNLDVVTSKLQRIAPTEPRTYLYLAIDYALANRPQEALRYINKALELKGDFYEALVLRESIESTTY